MQSTAPPRAVTDGVRWDLEWLDLGTAKFDLLLDVTDDAGVLTGHLEYSTDLFEASTAAAIADRLVRVLEAASAHPSGQARGTTREELCCPRTHRERSPRGRPPAETT